MMNNKNELVRVFVKGGILSPLDMKKIVLTAEELGASYVHFGSRQDMLFPIKEDNKGKLKKTFESIQTDYDYNQLKHQNIVTSYIADGILPTTPWLHIDIYHYIMEDIDYKHQLQINITDPKQTLVPLFTGNLNFVASEFENYWFLYLRFPRGEKVLEEWPVLVFSYDIPKVAKVLEEIYFDQGQLPINELFEHTINRVSTNNRNIENKLKLPEGIFPYYEGFHKMEGDNYWLGLYWRNNKYDIEFIKHFCDLCMTADTVKQIIITPWKSFIIKGIQWKERIKWEKLLGKFGINIRHSSVELNWHLPLLDKQALELKRYLVRAFDQNDISTYGLTFTIKTAPMVLFTSIVIEKNRTSRYAHKYDLITTFNILYSKDFNPNSTEYMTFAEEVEKEDLAPLLMELSKMYYKQLKYSPAPKAVTTTKPGVLFTKVYQCKNCLTIYNKDYGDPESGIVAGTSFEMLPDTYRCPLCDEHKSNYELMEVHELISVGKC
ncbi:rubredoxin domain-containing protein [Fulvivirgaceae bacterium BMA10]|uniref:Rubredoxin domain-containing protein n=1 Tax=Splendidivirga corallicola TaxID=3051826 RepID=A0ABT8KU91_9BACT|nr:rubredoxin domain-containing protein [Fulvivirgaceae bacterium BMA10]